MWPRDHGAVWLWPCPLAACAMPGQMCVTHRHSHSHSHSHCSRDVSAGGRPDVTQEVTPWWQDQEAAPTCSGHTWRRCQQGKLVGSAWHGQSADTAEPCGAAALVVQPSKQQRAASPELREQPGTVRQARAFAAFAWGFPVRGSARAGSGGCAVSRTWAAPLGAVPAALGTATPSPSRGPVRRWDSPAQPQPVFPLLHNRVQE